MVKRLKKRPSTSSSIFDFYDPKRTHTPPDKSQMTDEGGKVVNNQLKDEAADRLNNMFAVKKKEAEN